MSDAFPPEMTADERAAVESAAHALMLSPTMSLLLGLAKDFPLDIHDQNERRTALCMPSVDLIQALDHGRIHFDSVEDRAMLHALLMAVMEIVFEGRFGSQAIAQEVGHA